MFVSKKFSFFSAKSKNEKEKKDPFREHRWQLLSYIEHTSNKDFRSYGALIFASGDGNFDVQSKVGKSMESCKFSVFCCKPRQFERQSENSWQDLDNQVDGICESIIKKALDYRKQQL